MSDREKMNMQTATLDRSLIAYAYLAQATRSDGDLLGGLAPIFKPIAKIYAGKRFSPTDFAKVVGEMYGLKINTWAVEDLAPRLEQAGLLAKVPLAEGAHDYIYAQIAEDFDDVTEKDIASVLDRFIHFATPILKQYGQVVEPATLGQSLLRQLVNMEFVGILLKPERANSHEPRSDTLTLKKPTEQSLWENKNAAQSRIDVLCASFILDAYHKDAKLYSLIVRLATGALVSEVVLNFQDPGKTISLDGLTIILDTPFLMSALNVSEEASHAVASSICEQLREKGAKLAVFEHSVDELKGNLRGVIGETDAGRGFGPTARRLFNPTFRAYASALMQSPEARLKQEKITVIRAPKGTTAFKCFTADDQDKLALSIGHYLNALSRERDAESIAAVVRLRMNIRAKMSVLPAALYLFLTSNPRLADRSCDFLVERNVYSAGEVPPAISDRDLAGLLWVLYGGKAKELPPHVLLANCAKAVEPRSDVIRQMHRFLAELDGKQAEYFRALMTEERAGQYLMQLTVGESAFITNENAPVILEQMKAALIEKHEAERQKEIEAINKEHDAKLEVAFVARQKMQRQLHEADTKTHQISEQLVDTTRRMDALAGTIDRQKELMLEEQRRLAEMCVRQAIQRTNIVHIAIALSVGIISSLITWYGIQEASSPVARAIGITLAGVVVFLCFWKIPEFLFSAWMDHFRMRVYRRKLSEFGLDTDEALFEIDWHAKCVILRKQGSVKMQKLGGR